MRFDQARHAQTPLPRRWMVSVSDSMGGSYWRLWRLVGTPSWRFGIYRKVRRLFRPCGIEHLMYRRRARQFASLEKSKSQKSASQRTRKPGRNDARLVSELRSKRLVFTVTAGRTGTTLVTNLLKLLPDTTALHE